MMLCVLRVTHGRNLLHLKLKLMHEMHSRILLLFAALFLAFVNHEVTTQLHCVSTR
jgi:hypothetical protein